MLKAPIPLKKLSFEYLLRRKDDPESKVFYKYGEGEDEIKVLNDTFNIVLSRDIKANVRRATKIAFDISRRHPQKDVWLLNTYAGVKMMKDAVRMQLEHAKMPVPEAPVPEPLPQVDQAKLDVEDGDDIVSALPNMFLLNVAYGEWDTEQLICTIDERERQERGALEPRVEGEKYRAKPGTVLIINSFEFATISRWAREKLVRELIGLRESLGLTVIIFSQEMRRDMAAGMPGRGAIGYLAAKAGSVSRMTDPFERLIRSRDGANQRGNGVIHEAQMQESGAGGNKKKKVVIEPDYLFSEFSCNPWMGETEREGGHLASLARDIDLKMYYTEHKYDIFVRGQEPSSMAIKRGTYVQPQPVRTVPEPEIVRKLRALQQRSEQEAREQANTSLS